MSISEKMQENKHKWANYSANLKIVVIIGCILAVLLLSFTTKKDPGEIKLVKSGKFNNCPNKTIEQVANDYFESPKWSSGFTGTWAEKNVTFVNLEGKGWMHGKKVNLLLQFAVDEKNNSFQIRALEANDVPQPYIMIMMLVNNMCIN